MKKKTYQQPKMKVVVMEQTDIICSSTQSFSIKEDEGYEEVDW